MTDPLRNWLNDATPVITYDQAFFFFGEEPRAKSLSSPPKEERKKEQTNEDY